MKSFGGPVLLLDRADINTDEIIPAKYLTEAVKEALKPYLLEDLKLEGFDANGPWRGTARVAVARANFGCGSSREHAPVAIKAAGLSCVIAVSFARIFFRNAINIGLPVMVCPEASENIQAGDEVEIDLAAGRIADLTKNTEYEAAPFPPFLQEIISAGGLVPYTKKKIRC